MALFLRMGVFFFLIANYGLQVEGEGKTSNEKNNEQSVVVPQATNKDDSHREVAGGTGVSEIETATQTTNNDHKPEKKPSIVRRVSSKLPFTKSDKKDKPPTNTEDKKSNKGTGKINNVKGRDSTTGSSSSESDVRKQKTKVGLSKTDKDSEKKLEQNNHKGAKTGKGQRKEGSSSSSSSEPDDGKKKLNPKGKTSHEKNEAGDLKNPKKDKDSSSESSSDQQNKSNKKTGKVNIPKKQSSKDNKSSYIKNKTTNKDSGVKNANTPQAVAQPQGEKNQGMFSKLMHIPHIPRPSILSRGNKDKQQTTQ